MNLRPAAAERAYGVVKAGLLRGRFSPGTILNVHTLALEMGLSISPVRDAMGRLVGEQLVALRPEGGFQMPAITEEIAADLYQWNARLLLWAVRERSSSAARAVEGISPPGIAHDAEEIVAATEALFRTIASCSASREFRRSVEVATDRLAPLRHRESMLRDREGELRGLFDLVVSGDDRRLHDAIVRYHQRRVRQTASIVALLYSAR